MELQNKISDLMVSLDFETKARATNSKRGDEVRKTLAKMSGTPDALPPLLTEEEMSKLVISDLEFRWNCLTQFNKCTQQGKVVFSLDCIMLSNHGIPPDQTSCNRKFSFLKKGIRLQC